MYAPQDGVEIGAIVAEIGGYASKIGFAGEDTPRAYFPSHVGVPPSSEENNDDGMDVGNGPSTTKKGASKVHFDIGHNDRNLEIKNPLSAGLVEDWDIVEQIWHHANKTKLSVDLSQAPVLLVERAFNTPKLRQEYAELMFEKFQTPALFLSKDSVLSCFACGKTSAMVVDIGAECTTVAPIQEGWLESKGLIRSFLGGRMMDRYMLSLLEKGGTTVQSFMGQSKTSINFNNLHPSYRTYATLEAVRGLKESVCRMPEGVFNEADPKYAGVPRINYELPDGTVVAAGLERFQVPEILMNPEPVLSLLPADDSSVESEWSRGSLPKMVAESIFRCERDQQIQLINNVVLAGGGACIEGTPDRLKVEVEMAIYGQGQMINRVKVLQAGQQERKICAWLGGSIVASLGTFHEMWVSKGEYAEHGASIVDRKCP